MTEQAKVPAIRFAGFTDPWEQRKLGDVAPLQRGFDLPVNQMTPGPYPVVMSNGIGGWHSKYMVKGPGVVTGRSGTIGSLHYIEQNFWPHNTSLWVTSFNGNEPRFIYWLYASIGLERFGSGSGVPTLNRNDVHDLRVGFPCDVAEQRRIGTFFSRLDTLITLHQRKYDKLVVFKKSMLEKMFPKDGESVPEIRFAGFTDPWEQRKLGDVTDSFSGGTPDGSHASYYGGSIPFIRSAEINSDKTELFLTEKGLDNSSAKIVERGTVLYALYGATSGEVGIAAIKGAINQAILALSPHTGNDPLFLASWLRREKARIVDTYLQGGQGNLSGSIVKELSFALPQQKEQQVIGSFFSHLDNLITLHQRKLELLQNIKKSLLDKMFA
ncbi:type I restriction-modification system, subunit S [Bifidobacterium bifidum LMG 13195]|uniref:restriction endonuclease subunit S n=1 Tax=Bifidobacterium bifidum TaxID=1681 RepID=UPI0006425DB1|nr:type I restriction-modification system, subunit S [Bifidobacterium bifidum LMG 13195]